MTKDLIGKHIVRIERTRFYNWILGRNQIVVSAIILEDGTRFVASCAPGANPPGYDCLHHHVIETIRSEKHD